MQRRGLKLKNNAAIHLRLFSDYFVVVFDSQVFERQSCVNMHFVRPNRLVAVSIGRFVRRSYECDSSLVSID